MRRLFNDPYDIVEEMLEGYEKAHKETVHLLENDKRVVVYNEAPKKDKVGIVIGGGSGHEPLFLGYVGENFAMRSYRKYKYISISRAMLQCSKSC